MDSLQQARRRTGDVLVVAFHNAPSFLDDKDPYARIAQRAGTDFIEGVPAAVDSAVAAGTRIDFSPHDGHWNAAGHAIAAAAITAGLEDMELIPRREQSNDGR